MNLLLPAIIGVFGGISTVCILILNDKNLKLRKELFQSILKYKYIDEELEDANKKIVDLEEIKKYIYKDNLVVENKKLISDYNYLKEEVFFLRKKLKKYEK